MYFVQIPSVPAGQLPPAGHVAGADQHHVARAYLHAVGLAGFVQQVGADGEAGFEVVDAEDPGDVQQHAPAHHGLDVLDAAAGRAAAAGQRGAVAVVHLAAVEDVGQLCSMSEAAAQ